MKISIALILGALLGLFCVSVNAQVKEISEDEYWEAPSVYSLRNQHIEYTERTSAQYYTEGISTSRSESVKEADSAGATKVTRTSTNDGKEDILVTINIGKFEYTRENNDEWKVIDVSHRLTGGEYGRTASKFTVENADGLTIYSQTALYEHPKETIFESEKKFVNDSGKLVRMEFRRVENGVLSLTWTSTFEYSEGKIKIEAPIK